MCLIVWNPEGKFLNKEKMKNAHENNPHGFGIMWAENGEVKIDKGVHEFDYIWETIKNFKDHSFALHFRYRTHGPKTDELCHPFSVIEGKLAMMHNGIMRQYGGIPEKSDSQVFTEKLHDWLVKNEIDHQEIFSPEIMKQFEELIGNSNKLLFMKEDGEVVFANEQQGDWVNGIWYSNLYSLEASHKGLIDMFDWEDSDYPLTRKERKQLARYWNSQEHQDPIKATVTIGGGHSAWLPKGRVWPRHGRT